MCKTKRFTSLLVLFTLLSSQLSCTASNVCSTRVNDTQEKLLECVTAEGVNEHITAFQAIADANDGDRAAGTSGYDASAAYVADRLEEAGYEVDLHGFDFTFLPPETLQQTAPSSEIIEAGTIKGSGSGSVTGPVTPVDLALGEEPWPTDPSESNSGCEASDFEGLDFSGPNDIVLVQEGACLFSIKALNAEAAGAEAVIFFVKDAFNIKVGLPIGSVSMLLDGSPSHLTIPVIGTSFLNGIALSQEGSEAFVDVKSKSQITQYNVIAELPGDEDGNIVMVGAHLDSIQGVAGISDNGSGSAAILETAVQMSEVQPRNTVRFAWWGAEEAGVVGSEAYVTSLTPEERDEIAMYLNFDMIGSPNYVYFIFDGDNSDAKGAGPGPEGSAEIEKLFESYYTGLNLPFKGTDLSGRGDYRPFMEAGIPVGGIFTGADEIKSLEEAEIWGGTPRILHDPCYHEVCDDIENLDREAYRVNSDAVAFSTLYFAMNGD